MSEMTTQEILAKLGRRSISNKCHLKGDEADAIAARLKALEEAWRAAFKYLPQEIQEDITGSLFPNDYRGEYLNDLADMRAAVRAILDTVREVE